MLNNLVRELRVLKSDAEPLPLNFENVQAIQSLLRDLRANRRWIPIPLGGSDAVEQKKSQAGQ